MRCAFDRTALRRRGIPRGLARLVLRAMAADPADRHPQAEHLARDLERFLARPRRLRRMVAASGMVCLFAMLMVLARYEPKPPGPPSPTAAPLRIDAMEILPFREDPPGHVRPLHMLGIDTPACRPADLVRIRVRLSARVLLPDRSPPKWADAMLLP